MYRPVFRLSRTGLITSGLFLCMAATVFFWVLYSATTNPADAGESGIMLLPFAMPWIMLLPQAWVTPLAGVGAIILNALLLYFIFGGLRLTRITGQKEKACPHCLTYPLRKKFSPQANFAPYNICVDCGNRFTVDPATVKRHIIALILSPFMLGTTIMTYFKGNGWLGWMLVSHVIFWGYFIYANSKVVFVPYPPGSSSENHDE